MALYRIAVVCHQENHHHSERNAFTFEPRIYINSTEEEALRRVLGEHVDQFKKRYSCDSAIGYLMAAHDIEDLRIRHETTIVRTDEDGFVLRAMACTCCGWRSNECMTFSPDGKLFCLRNDCQEAAKKHSINC